MIKRLLIISFFALMTFLVGCEGNSLTSSNPETSINDVTTSSSSLETSVFNQTTSISTTSTTTIESFVTTTATSLTPIHQTSLSQTTIPTTLAENNEIEDIDKIVAISIQQKSKTVIVNDPLALSYTSSGTSFRRTDDIHLMSSAFFLEQYEFHKNAHAYNGFVPFLPHGVVVVLDATLKVVHLRMASSLLEIDGSNQVKTINLDWSNTLDATNGGGNFKNITSVIESLIPEGGYILFTGAAGDQVSKKFLISGLFDSNYTGGLISLTNQTVDISTTLIAFLTTLPPFDDTLVDGEMNISRGQISGIPYTTYYRNDDIQKPVLFFFHGFGSSRDVGIMGRGELLADLGFFVIAMDAYLHGERQTTLFQAMSGANKQKETMNIVIQSALDAQMLYEHYFKHHPHVLAGDVFAYGVSMGGAIAFYLTTIMEELKTMVSILGSPSFVEFYEYKQRTYGFEKDAYYDANILRYGLLDPLGHPTRFDGKHVFMASGSLDSVVPSIYANQLKLAHEASDSIVFKLYETAHVSNLSMQEDAFAFLVKHKP